MKKTGGLIGVLFIACVLLSTTIVFAQEGGSWYDSQWAYRKKITIDGTNVDADLTNFPLYVHFEDADIGANCTSSGFDIRFTASDGSTELDYEREHFFISGGTATGDFWVRVPTINSGSTTDIYIYYNNSGASDGDDRTNVWAGNYIGVYHMYDNTTSSINDSTSVNNHGSKSGANAPIEVDSRIYKGQYFDRVGDYIKLAYNHNLSNFIVTVWFQNNLTGGSTYNGMSFVFNHILSAAYGIGLTANASGDIFIYDDLQAMDIPRYRTPISFGDWHYAMMRINGTTGSTHNETLRVDENLVGDNVGITINQQTPVETIIGARTSAAQYSFNGTIDELRISNVSQNPAWYKFEFFNINESDHELSWGSVEGLSASSNPNYIQSDVGDINIAPLGDLIFNISKIQMRSPDGSWSCCGPNAQDVWSCTAGECS